MFSKVTLNFENGKKLVIKAPDNSKENVYVKDLEFNGKKIKSNFIRHNDLLKGGTMIFRMSSEPEKSRGTNEESFPFSMSTK